MKRDLNETIFVANRFVFETFLISVIIDIGVLIKLA